ncbi:molybdenum cofactor guanylyltransferase [Lactobacillus sp. CC-MHH1034]|uniref:molybdenum cofactor guanylyltransferase n=1 Tax=Agrilactobacillus fermenti TaxID=2586909 RepID=UPI001E5AC127|nr:molybdenum cofactor guanylyltransferase [Agrilactobacillus fermenti]MCD2255679.1 molybdenum cofactor guanylyltransferase [Agrilactobacillus fermenti]
MKTAPIGLILAGGHSRRFGTDKALFQPRGQLPQVQQVYQVLAPLVSKVVISANAQNATALSQLFKSMPEVQIIQDRVPYIDQGPLSGIYATAKQNNLWMDILLAATDYRALTTDLLRHLKAQKNVYAQVSGQAHYTVSHFETNATQVHHFLQTGNRRLQDFLKQTCHCQPLILPAHYRSQLQNNNQRSLHDDHKESPS